MAAASPPAMAPPSTSDRFPNGSEMFGAVVDIIVGRGQALRTFKVHKGVLCFYSGYFKAALEGEFREASDGAVKLPTEDPDVFETFTLRLYSRRLINPVGENDTEMLSMAKLFKIWVFADAHRIPMLQNEMLNFLHLKIKREWRFTIDIIPWLYEQSTPASGLRKCYMEAIARTGDAAHQCTIDMSKSWTKDALIDVMQWVWKNGRKTITKAQFEKWDLCRHHVHEEGVKCKKAWVKSWRGLRAWS